MNYLNVTTHREYKAYIPLTEEDKAQYPGREFNYLRIDISYHAGGLNYFNCETEKRGYRLSSRPVTLTREKGFTSESYMMLSSKRECGGYLMLEEATRYNFKRLTQLAEKYDPLIPDIARAVIKDDIKELIFLVQGREVAHV